MSRYRVVVYAVLLVLLGALPFVLNVYILHVLIMSMIFAIFALAYDVVIGAMGQFSFGHHALWGVGAYISGLLALDMGISVWLAIPIAIVGTAVLGLLIGLISLRLRGAYLGIITLGFAMIIQIIVARWDTVTHGYTGVKNIPSPILFGGVVLDQPFSYYYLVLASLLVTIFFLSRMHISRLGMSLNALRQNEKRSGSLGIPIFKCFVLAFTISSAISGLSGALYAHYMHTLTPPTTLSIWYLWQVLIIVLVGGSGTIGGPLTGALLFVFLPEFLRIAEAYRFAIFGVILIACVIFMPEGVYPKLRSILINWQLSRVFACLRR